MKLYCVRHAEAENVPEDKQRCLSAKGEEDVKKIACFLQKYDLHVHELMHSDKLRAVQTAKILASHLKVDQMTERGLLLDANAPIDVAVAEIKLLMDDTMLVGHLPFMDKLVSALVARNENFFPIVKFPPATVICLETVEDQHWVINWVLQPQLIVD